MLPFQIENPEKIVEELVTFIRESGSNKPFVIGLSGGIDSTLTCELAIRAVGAESIKALVLKNIRYPSESLEVIRRYTEAKGIKVQELDTNELRLKIIELLGIDTSNIKVTSSLDARVTDLIIRTIAQREGRIYLGTINGSERFTGWYPKNSLFGDICPIGGLLKYEVQIIAKHLNLPVEITNSVSKDASRICSGCGELEEFKGITYEQLDTVLYFYEKGLRDNSLIDSLKEYDLPMDIITRILSRISLMQHKQIGFPLYPKFR